MKETTRDFSILMDDADAFRQRVRMAAMQVAGLKPEELAQALAYEVEPSSGIPATEADVTFKTIADPDPTVRVYDVAVKRRKRRGAASGDLNRWTKAAIVLACVIGAVLVADATLLVLRSSALAKTASERRPLQSQLDRIRSQEKAARDEATDIRTRREASVRAQNAAAALRTTHADLLDAITEAWGERAVVTAIAPGKAPSSLTVTSIGISAEAAAQSLSILTARASQKGWRILPESISASTSGTTVSFGLEATRSRE